MALKAPFAPQGLIRRGHITKPELLIIPQKQRGALPLFWLPQQRLTFLMENAVPYIQCTPYTLLTLTQPPGPVLLLNYDSSTCKYKERLSLEALCKCNFHFAAPEGSIQSSQVDSWASCQSKGYYSYSALWQKNPLWVSQGPVPLPQGQSQRKKGGPKSQCQHSWAARITQTP